MPPHDVQIRFLFMRRWAALINPVFVLPGALSERANAIGEGMKNSVMLDVGQFCTCPGLAVGIGDAGFARFVERLEELIQNTQPGTMLYPGILQSYEASVHRLNAIEEVRAIRCSITGSVERNRSSPFDVRNRSANFHGAS